MRNKSGRKPKSERQRLVDRIKANDFKIKKLQTENRKLFLESLVLSDGKRWFTEEMEVHGRGKNKKEYLVGKVHWKEGFKDEDTGRRIFVQRTQVVRIDGKWEV